MSTILLSFLLNDLVDVSEREDVSLSAITLDSREVKNGTLFVALKGTVQHGLDYAEAAEKSGAIAIIWESDEHVSVADLSIPQFEIEDLRQQLGLIADRFYGSPSKKLNIVGITGTDGKTSVSHFMAQSIENCAVIGTIGLGRLDNLQQAKLTTPDVLTVHKNFAEMKQQGVSTVAMEVSSHALDQGRVADVSFDVAVLTNLSRDHLDYHKTLEAYAEAKEKLFSWPSLKAIVINFDDAFGQKIAKQRIGKKGLHKKAEKWGGVLSYGIGSKQDYPQDSLVAEQANFSNKGINAQIHYQGQVGELTANVLGRFNLSNLLAALGAMLALGESLEEALIQLSKVETVAGRMQKVTNSNTDFLTVVDYAHTPNALQTVLKALREHTENKLICVFGCGGDRDSGKRPLMAAIAEEFSDVVIVTDDNPRSENPQEIMQDIVAGFKETKKVTIEHDRATAIKRALKKAKNGDAVLIAGKGHENVQILATGSVPFDDREQASKVLQELAA